MPMAAVNFLMTLFGDIILHALTWHKIGAMAVYNIVFLAMPGTRLHEQ